MTGQQTKRPHTYIHTYIHTSPDSLTEPEREPLIRFIRQSNTGIAGARNRGIEEAQGEYLAFLDHDDIWLPEKLQRQVELLDENKEAALVYSPVESFGSTDMKIPDYELVCGNVFEIMLRQNKIHSASCVMVRKSCLENYALRFDPACEPCDDWDFYLRLARHFPFTNTGKKLVRYRLHDSNASNNVERMYLAGIKVLQRQNVISSGEKKARRHALAKHYYGLAYLCAQQKRYAEFFRWNIKAVAENAADLRAWSLFLRLPLLRRAK